MFDHTKSWAKGTGTNQKCVPFHQKKVPCSGIVLLIFFPRVYFSFQRNKKFCFGLASNPTIPETKHSVPVGTETHVRT